MKRDELLNQVYQQLRRQAEKTIRQERPDHTLSATALVHEAYLRLGDSFANGAHFYGAAAEAMRRVLVDHARSKLAQKRGGLVSDETSASTPKRRRIELADAAEFSANSDPEDFLALDDAISRLENHDSQSAAVVRLRYFTGLGVEETAKCLSISPRTVKRDWQFARAFLYRSLSDETPPRSDP